MSLKAIHIVFIVSATFLCFGVGFYGVRSFLAPGGGVGDLAFGVGSFAVGLALVYYGKLFLKKLKHIGYL
jgi:hypothetical protein